MALHFKHFEPLNINVTQTKSRADEFSYEGCLMKVTHIHYSTSFSGDLVSRETLM